jgi:serine/threonine-protein kinase RsbW
MVRTVKFPGRYDALPKISDFVVDAAKEAGLSDSQVYAVDLAVDEACTNIIDHAYGGENLGEIQCTCNISDEGLTITLCDKGLPFKPAKIPAPKENARLKDLKSGGAGLYLIHKMMDIVHYDFIKGLGNVLTMTKLKAKKEVREG